jgi:hypothetical protein
MIRYELMLRGNVVEVILDVAEPEDYGQLEFRGEPATVRDVKYALYGATGLGGHLIQKETTPIDLATAMAGGMMREFAPKRVAGDAVLARYVPRDPSLP